MVGNAHRSAQLRTLAGIIRATGYALICFYVFIQILGALGVPLGSFIAAAGVIGLGISFGAQSLFKDMLTGLFILLEDQYAIGDTIKIAGLTGTVENLTLRVTTLRDGDGTLYIVPNSQITTVSNLSRDFSVASLSVSVSTTADPDHVLNVLRKLAAEVRADEAFKDVVIADPTSPASTRSAATRSSIPSTFACRSTSATASSANSAAASCAPSKKRRSPSAPPPAPSCSSAPTPRSPHPHPAIHRTQLTPPKLPQPLLQRE